MNSREGFILLIIIVSSIFLRFWNLGSIPHWDWDEGVNMDISWNLINGRLQWGCLSYPFVPHPPFFFMVTGLLLKFFGNDLIVLRALCALLGVGTTFLVYLIGRNLLGERIGLLSGLLYAVYPSALYFGRIGFANNLLVFWVALSMYSFIKYIREKNLLWFYLMCLSTGLSTITESNGFCILASLTVLFWLYDRRNLFKMVSLSLVFFVVFVVVMLNVAHDAFISDLMYSSGRFNPVNAFFASFVVLFFVLPKPNRLKEWVTRKIIEIYSPVFVDLKPPHVLFIFYFLATLTVVLYPPTDDLFFMGFDFYWFGLIGFFFIKDKFPKDTLLAFFFVFFIVLLGLDRADHMLIPIYPLLTLGTAILISVVFDFVSGFFASRLRKTESLLLSILLVSYPVAMMVYYDMDMFFNGKRIRVEDIGLREKVAEYINNNTVAEDVVIVDSHLTRMINCRSSVLIQAASYNGKSIEYLRADYGIDRFVFNCSHMNAKYIAMLNGTREWAMNQSSLVGIMKDIEGWDIHRVDNFLIYRNPER